MTKQMDFFIEARKNIPTPQPEIKVYPSHILCPNCMKVKLIQTGGYDYSCTNCNQDFTDHKKV